MTLSLWLSLVAICMMGAMSPGPSLAVVLKHSIHGSMKNGMLAALSHGVGVGFYAAASLLGLGALMLQFPTVYQVLVYLGAAYLAYLGVKILLAKPSNSELKVAQQSGSAKQALQDGFAIAFLNPKLAVFFLALFSQFIDPANLSFKVGLIMCLTVFTIDTGWYLIVAALTELSKKRFAFTKSSPWFDKILAVIFIGLAIRVVLMV
ncbi:LysE family translocator [Pseudoalteromonas sp. SR44-5]|jgi:threonine/homoserine/homoserine lactone efflux protein|uniref:LysE family translocator n=1 Tax=Pseudoalteromonas neustonica TaxID=1840331 RepID=A0ABY3F8F4_9GAMM|nr:MULTISPECIES: LysE family translocator [Pseudoalteromonas]MBB1294136.1 LysE family translocator [Pseudoalteromonas sp. SR41-4]MBB1303281.1 LysE family translocator [Pseudoalteromonas sp. SR44-8]MBB1311462.1 LysE family translocator [Pseudoalteromonas sp. SR41-8]MBB1343090.1 LysE family translocator [Pseudoalteromonas sp. SR45-6]MBB1368341.1 LysE family translocator [Pseudoalteromonas sp. SR44-5]|tara:strand:+ start:2468 stop:3085 length:618 start_codon:yes stop_codon:yes gene_type:complete